MSKGLNFVNTATAVFCSISILQCFLLHDAKHQRWHHWLINVTVFIKLPPIERWLC